MMIENFAFQKKISLLLLFLLVITACNPFHSVVIQDATHTDQQVVVDSKLAEELNRFLDEEDKLPLDRLLHQVGYQVVEKISLYQQGKPVHYFDWVEVAEQIYWQKDGSISFQGEIINPDKIEVWSDAKETTAQFRVTDLANTILSPLSCNLIEGSSSTSLTGIQASHVVFIFWDGLGYLDIQKALELQIVPTMASLPEPLMGITVFPSKTSVATAAMITGLPPEKNGVDMAGIRSSDAKTIFNILEGCNKTFSIVEGNTLYLNNLGGGHLYLNPDVDGNASTDDEVFVSAMQAMKGKMPDFLWVHFHGLDDSGHTYSPWSEEYVQSMKNIDGFVRDLINASPTDTLFLISADHGMHPSTADVRSGEHGTLAPQDMLIPLVLYLKSNDGDY